MSGNVIVALFFGVTFGFPGLVGLIYHAISHGGERACNHVGFIECRRVSIYGGDQ